MRLPGWEKELSCALNEARDKPFEWGRHDCAHFVFRVRSRLTGEPEPSIGSYKTERGGFRAMRKLGPDMLAAATAVFGAPLPTALLAQRGDIVLIEALGICLGASAVFVGPEGLITQPLTDCRAAWRV